MIKIATKEFVLKYIRKKIFSNKKKSELHALYLKKKTKV